jgi:hypothetical protein
MSKGPGRVSRAILDFLADHVGERVTYGEVTVAIYGEGFTESERKYIGAAIRTLEKQGKVETRWEAYGFDSDFTTRTIIAKNIWGEYEPREINAVIPKPVKIVRLAGSGLIFKDDLGDLDVY